MYACVCVKCVCVGVLSECMYMSVCVCNECVSALSDVCCCTRPVCAARVCLCVYTRAMCVCCVSNDEVFVCIQCSLQQ